MQFPRRLVLAALLGALPACSSAPSTAPAAPGGASTAGTGAGKNDGATRHELPTGETRVGSEKLVDRRHKTGLAADTLDQVKSSAPVPKSSTEIYRAAAPATVIVRVKEGMGSGVVIDPAGWVLTNHHVIDSGREEDFRYKATVILGKLSSASGAMERVDKEYEALVYKTDKLHDLALLKLVDPPKDLAAVTIADTKPSPGNDVVALGHASAGMLWALKSGQISALGKLSETLSHLVGFQDDEEGKKAKEAFIRYIESKNLGMVIQSTCNILPGDSGGPLLDRTGRLIGLNVFAQRDSRTGGLLSFHVHLNEIRDFIAKRPDKPAQILPDPWLEGGGDLSWEDADLDGKADVLMMQGRQPCLFCPRQSTAVFMDVDQSTFATTSKLPDLNEVFDKREFDAEAVYLQLEQDVLVWYDTNNDGRFDAVLYDKGTTGIVTAGYHLKSDGSLEKNEGWRGHLFKPDLFADRELGARFARITRAAFPSRYTDGSGSLGSTLPEPVGKVGSGRALDLDGDGRFDAFDVTSAFSKHLVVDADQDFTRGVGVLFKMADVDHGALDPELSVVSQSTHMWVFYDTDDDKRFDLALHAPGARLYAAMEAWNIDASGAKTPAPEHVGRKLIRPELFAKAAHRERIRAMIGKGLLPIMSAQADDGIDSFPDPIEAHRGTGMGLLDNKTVPRGVVTLMGLGSDGYLVDLDQSSGFFGPKDKLDVEKRVTDGKFDAEFAYFQRNGMVWTFYDVDFAKGYDVVLVGLDSSGQSRAAFRIEKGRATSDEALAAGKMVRPSLFKSPLLRGKLKALSEELFAPSMVE